MSVRPGYAAAALALLLTELAIAVWVKDRFVRPTGGDVLAVLLVYCGLRAITRLRVIPAAIVATAVGFAVEAGQAVHLVDRLGLASSRWARTSLGTSFAVADLCAYVLGGAIAILAEAARHRWARQR